MTLEEAKARVAECEEEVEVIEGFWAEFGAEWGDRLSGSLSDLREAQQELEELMAA